MLREHSHPGKEERNKSLKISVWAISLFTCSSKTLRNRGEKIRWRQSEAEVGELAAKKAMWQQTRTRPLSLALIHTHRGEKWLMINHLSQNSPVTFPNRYTAHARREKTELLNKILNDLKPTFVLRLPVWIPMFAWISFRISPLWLLSHLPALSWRYPGCCSSSTVLPQLDLLDLSPADDVHVILFLVLFCLSVSHHIYQN